MGILDYKASYRRNLPHLQPAGASFFITARLTGSLPQSVIARWKEERRWLKQLSERNPQHFEKVKADFERSWFFKFEEILDGGRHGPIWLKDDRVAALVAESLHYRDGKVFRLDAYSIMPNHLHIQLKPLLRLPADGPRLERSAANEFHDSNDYYSLASILKSLKGYTARKCNEILNRDGEFWAHESLDHYIRDAEEWFRIRAYILNNPVKARLIDNWEAWKWNYSRKG
jgi:REP element-mobilizing transposase RayT